MAKTNRESIKPSRVLRGTASGLVVSCAFLLGFVSPALRAAPTHPEAVLWQMSTLPAALSNALKPVPLADGPDPQEAFSAATNAIQTEYTPPTGAARPSENRLTQAAIEGLLSSLHDRYAEYYSPKEYREMLEEQSGNFVGIGATLQSMGNKTDKRVVIEAPLPGSPAERAGIKPGDVVVAVDGESVVGWSVEAVIAKIRGDEGTMVKVSLRRKNKPVEYQIRREMVSSPVVESRMVDKAKGVGYIALTIFNEQSDAQFMEALRDLERQGLRALILDLRDNPGGLLDAAQDVASRFLVSGPVVWVKEKNGEMSTLDVKPGKQKTALQMGKYPLAVLVNGYSASAAEILAGAIQDGNVGKIVGERTYGKGLVQTIIPLVDDSAIKITTQRYYTRSKRDINIARDDNDKPLRGTGGIPPDYPVALTDAQAAKIREADSQNQIAKADRLDPQLQTAVRLLTARAK